MYSQTPDPTYLLTTEDDGILPLRLTEPISSLQLTPFAFKAAKATGVKTVGELADFIWKRETKSLGQGHIDEMKRKIEQFVGTPPFPYEKVIDWPALLRLALSRLDSTDKAILVTYTQIQSIVPLSPQESKEAQLSLYRNAREKFQSTVATAQSKTTETLLPLLTMIFTSLIKPHILKRGGVIHAMELRALLFERGNIPHYLVFEKTLSLLETLLDKPTLLSGQLLHVQKAIWAITPTHQRLAQAVLEDACTLLKEEKPTDIHALSTALARCRARQWDDWSLDAIKRLLFWYFID